MNIHKTIIGTLLIFVLIETASGGGSGATITICPSGCAYSSIQDAIDNASDGDTILIYSGIYHENVNITKQLTLNGISNPVVDVGSGSAITLAADGIALEGFTATGSGFEEAGIKVTSSNNTLIGNNASNNNIGIYLFGSSSNTLSGNNASNNGKPKSNHGYCNYGISLVSSNNNTLNGNNASNNCGGIYLTYSSNNALTGNNASNNIYGGISLSDSSKNTLSGNNASNNNDDGIYLESSSKNTLKNNVMTGNKYNFRLTGYDASSFQNQIDKSNLVDGKPIYYIKGAVNTIYDASTNAGTFYCINCLNVTLKDLNLTNNGYGVFFWKTALSKIQNVNASKNEIGIHLSSSSNNNTLDGNHAFKNSAGISLSDYSSNNTLRNNNASNNSYDGISLERSNNNKLRGNKASNNKGSGISLLYSSNNMLKGNNASKNRYGIQISTDKESEDGDADNSCTNNMLKNNIMTGNMYNFELDAHRCSDFQNIDKSNLVDGKPIYYIIGASNTIYDSSTNAGTFYCINCVNVTLKDLNLTNNGYGVFFSNTTLSKIQNVKVYNNSDYGIYLYYSSNNTLSGNKASNNYGGGFYLYSSSSNKLSRNNASNNGGGFSLSYSSSNTLSGNNASNNGGGISLDGSSKNKIYNNIFKNTNNVQSFYSKKNKWNTTRQSGTNIIGGPYIGGNFWANPDGKGFSQKCTDENNDGICDKSYTLDAKTIDYLPLSMNFTKDKIPPKSVSKLKNVSYASSYINWTWKDPKDIDFKKVMVFIDSKFKKNVSKGTKFYNATNFEPNTKHTISTWTVDINGNINKTWTNSSARTASITV